MKVGDTVIFSGLKHKILELFEDKTYGDVVHLYSLEEGYHIPLNSKRHAFKKNCIIYRSHKKAAIPWL